MERIKSKILLIFLVWSIINSCNPFAPELDEESKDNAAALTEQKDIDGLFKNFQYAYNFKDTTVYGALLDENFIFVYRDYSANFDVAWGKQEEMKITNMLFKNTQDIKLIWNEIIMISIDSTSILRSFNLTITFNPMDIAHIDGKVNFTLRKDEQKKWRIVKWFDESNF